jgi:cytochrome c peroxidase
MAGNLARPAFFAALALALALAPAAPAAAQVADPQVADPQVADPQVAAPQDTPSSPIRIELGRRLFYDADLSINGTMACATCHEQRLGFSDGNRTHPGALDDPGKRNVPGLQNVALLQRFTWASRATVDLEHQALTPLLGRRPVEMGMKPEVLAPRLAANPCYRKMFAAAFPEKNGEISLATVTQALASFERRLVSFNSPYDKAERGGPRLPAEAEAGRALFDGKGGCATCHSGRTFTDGAFHRLEPPSPADRGLAEETGEAADAGFFRTPGLRNAALTAPYFHDGKAATLADAIRRHGPQTALSEKDLSDIAAFLGALTDPTLLSDPRLSLPEATCPL